MPTIAAEHAWQRDGWEVSDDPARIDLARVHGWLAGESYWSAGIPLATLKRAIDNSLVLGLYRDGLQAGFARVVTDRATFAYLCDVWIDVPARGAGLGEWLIECVIAHPDLRGLRRFCLVTRDAHGLYTKYGFVPMADPSRYLEINDREVYSRPQEAA
jgi:ribosomal protein S18 acetylase RimI-like enzyme